MVHYSDIVIRSIRLNVINELKNRSMNFPEKKIPNIISYGESAIMIS